MPTHASAEKRARQNIKRRLRNKAVRSRMTTSVRQFDKALAEGDLETARDAALELEATYARAASKGVIPSERASRKVSRINQRLNRALSEA